MPRFRKPHPMLATAIILVVIAGILLAASYYSATTGPLAERRGGRLADVHALNAIAVAPDGTVYLATDEGLAHGPDEAGDWHRRGKEHHNFTAVAAAPGDAAHVWLAGRPERTGLEHPDLGVRQSHDGGKHVEFLAREKRLVTALAVSAGNPDVLWSAEPEGAFILRSEDGGATWSTVAEAAPLVRALAADPSEPGVAYAAGAGLRRTADGGATWETLRTDDLRSVAVDAADPNALYVVTADAVERSADGGRTWTPLELATTDGPVVSVSTHPTAAGVVVVATAHAEVYRSDDGGAAWTRLR